MQQTLHLLMVDIERGSALVAAFGSNWSLPVVTCAESVRAHAAVLRWLMARGLKGESVGQWLGRVALDATDWLMVIRAAPQHSAPEQALAWTLLDALPSATPLIEYQGWAVTTSLERGSRPSVPGPFGRLTWLDEVKAWIATSVGSTRCDLTPYRVTAHEIVLGADTERGRVYFKGLTPERSSEARLTQTLAALAPASFARTLALDIRCDRSVWWLTAACPGNAGVSAAPVARALARLQRAVVASGPILRALRSVDLAAATRWAAALVDDPRCATAIEQSFERVAAAPVPKSWIPMDLDPTNVLVDESGHVRFIDLDDSFFGPAPLAMAVFAKRCRDRSSYEVYEQSWSPPLTDVDWPAFETTATVVDAWLGWQRMTRNTERGEVHCALDLVSSRIGQRLRRALDRVVASSLL